MSRSLAHGPNGTPVDGLSAVTYAIPPLNYDADFVAIEEGPGRVVYTDVTSAQDQPSTLRIAQQSRPNVYAGTSIDASAYLPNKKGTDTIVEVKETWSITESTDPTFLQQAPVRCAITLTLPTTAVMSYSDVQSLIGRAVAALFTQGEATAEEGLVRLLHGVVKRG